MVVKFGERSVVAQRARAEDGAIPCKANVAQLTLIKIGEGL